MALKELSPKVIPDFAGMPEFPEGMMAPNELMEKMATCSYEYHHAWGELKKISRQQLITSLQIKAVVQAKQPNLLKNKEARELFTLACADPKFKPTVDFTESIVYMETQSLTEPYTYWETEMKRAYTYYQMLTGQLIWYQSQNRLNGAELMTLGGQP